MLKKCKIYFILGLLLLLCQCASALEAMEVEGDLEERAPISLVPQQNYMVQAPLDRAIDSIDKEEKSRFSDATPWEAEKYFFSYLVEKLGEQKAQAVAPEFFTATYFGEEDFSSREFHPEDEPYWLHHISNMLMDESPGNKTTMESTRKKWPLRIQLLTPNEALNAFKKHTAYAQKYAVQIELFQKSRVSGDKNFDEIFGPNSKCFVGKVPDSMDPRSYFCSLSIGFLNREMIQNLHVAGQKMMQRSEKGDTFVIFGNSPYLIGRVLQRLSSKNEELSRQVIFFPFSGAPDSLRKEIFPALCDLVTSERLDHLKDRMEKVELSPHNKKLKTVHIVGIIASDSGPAYFMEVFYHTFKDKGLKPPRVHVFSMNEFNIENLRDLRQSRIADRSAKDGESLTLTFPSKKNPRFHIPATVVDVKNHVFLDRHAGDDWRFFPQYNASFWNKEYDHLLSDPYPPYKEFLLKYFDAHLEDIITSQ